MDRNNGVVASSMDISSIFSLEGKVVLVTGAASGLGKAIAIALDAFGANVVLADVNLDGANEVAEVLRNDCLVTHTDVTSTDSVIAMVGESLRRFGRISVAFNIPGMNIRKPLIEVSDDEWSSILALNLTGVFTCAREVGREMLKRGSGSMVNMASARGLAGGPCQAAYSSSKAGIIQLTKCLAIEWAPGVRVNALAPGYFETPLVEDMMKDPKWFGPMRDLHAMKRFGKPQEIIGAAVFLASDASSFVTGAVISVDGGWTAS
jgi:gluconate 5-dehydrogenase